MTNMSTQNMAFDFAPTTITEDIRVSDSLANFAGEFSEQIACLDPFPHTKALKLSRVKLHLMLLAFAKGANGGDLLWLFEDQTLRDAEKKIFGGSTPGLLKILHKSPTRAFERQTYGQLLELIASENALKILRHMDCVTADSIAIAHHLPDELRLNKFFRHVASPNEAQVIKRVFALVPFADDDARLDFVHKFTPIKRRAIWERFMAEMQDKLLLMPSSPNIDHPNFERLRTKSMFDAAANEFGNCVAIKQASCFSGECAIFVFRRDDIKVMIGIEPAFGSQGVVTELEMPHRQCPPRDILQEMDDILTPQGFNFTQFSPLRSSDGLTARRNYKERLFSAIEIMTGTGSASAALHALGLLDGNIQT
jgi:hypothetical protein